MNDELSYAEMLEIPVETVTVKKKEKKKKWHDDQLSDQLVREVNDRMDAADPAYAESKPIERELDVKPKAGRAKKILIAELVVVVALCAAIFITNLLLPNSAINTFVRGLFGGETQTADSRTYADFTLSPIVNEYADVDVAVSETGVMSFTAECAVYAPCEGKVESVYGSAEDGYSVLLRHSDSFTTIISGLDAVYIAEGEEAPQNVPLAYSNGERTVRVIFYDGEAVLDCYTVGEGGIAWS